jgi:mRNA-degrading endonuclease RelE of RelBE toxin-antitoxin system
MYKVTFLSDAEASFRKLDKSLQKRVAQKIDWLAEHADRVIHHPLTSLPEDLRGLCRIRIGD